MRTNIVLDDQLVEEAFKYSRAKSKKGLVEEVLKEFVENKKRRNLLELSGKIRFVPQYDYKKLREGR